MDLQLKGRVALVTGSTAGIGFAIGSSLAGEGATVIINGRTERRVGDAIATIRQKHPEARLEASARDLSTAAAAAAYRRSIHPRRYFDQQPRLLRAQAV